MADVATARSIPADAIPDRPNVVLEFVRKEPLGFIGFLIILLYFVFAVGAKWIAPYDPEAVDFTAMLDALRGIGYAGWVVVEQDVLPGQGAPGESAIRNREFLRQLGV